MSIESFLGLLFAVSVMAMVPGPIMAALIGRALFHGVRSTLGFLAGVFVADLIWLVIAFAGLGYLAQAYGPVFLLIKYVGASYLIYMGLKTLWTAYKGVKPLEISNARTGKIAGFLSGLLITLGNPKLVVFYLSIVPNFIDMTAVGLIDGILVAIAVPTVFVIFNFGWAYAADRARLVLKSSRALQIMNYLSGGLLFGAGVVVVSSQE